MANDVADNLDRAADLLEPEGAWTRHAYGVSASGQQLGLDDLHRAVSLCVAGAIRLASGREESLRPYAVLMGIDADDYGFGIGNWNDHPGRTQTEVVARLREAARLARAEQVQPC